MQMVPLQVSARSREQQVGALRRSGGVPCILYGNNTENQLLQCTEKDIRRAYTKAGGSTLVELDLDGKKIPVLIHAISLHPVSDAFAHVDFYAVDMTKEVETNVSIRLDGESPAVKELSGILVTPLDHVTVRCLPSRLPHELTASISSLAAFHDSLTVADLAVPEGVTILNDPTLVIATVQEQRKEEEAAPATTSILDEAATPAEGATAEGAAPAETDKKKEKDED